MTIKREILCAAFLTAAVSVGVCPQAGAQSTTGTARDAHHVAATSLATARNASPMLDDVRSATEIYSDRRVAISAGYRRIGRDFPSMGEHWLNPRLIVEGVFDPLRPSVLSYATINGKPVLLGVVYAIPLARGELPPSGFAAGVEWHEHNGTLDEESLTSSHDEQSSANAARTVENANGTRIAVLHAWIRVPTSNGIFSADNWALPFFRLGLPVPTEISRAAARALSLLSGGKTFFADMAGSSTKVKAMDILGECQAKAESIVSAARQANRALTVDELSGLDVAWRRAMMELGQVDADAATRLNGGVHLHSP